MPTVASTVSWITKPRPGRQQSHDARNRVLGAATSQQKVLASKVAQSIRGRFAGFRHTFHGTRNHKYSIRAP